MMCAPVLKLPDLDEEFVVETDASGEGIGEVLQQQSHPIAYLSKTLSPKHQVLSIYEKEFLAVLQALEKWRGYLLDRHFKVKSYHFSLKYLLDQRISNPIQMKWLPSFYKTNRSMHLMSILKKPEEPIALSSTPDDFARLS
ncbi:putative mitochondrial protein [Tanacetum coccineum]|uniref:Mitochondrial protein n=1 Tax=Tanacetum coccineum TaxID=301880 RepID=A0ABQ5CSX5_9ASTR